MVFISHVLVQNLSSSNLPLKYFFLNYYFSCQDKLKKVQEIMLACIYCSCIISFCIFPLFLMTPEKNLTFTSTPWGFIWDTDKGRNEHHVSFKAQIHGSDNVTYCVSTELEKLLYMPS